MNEYNQRITQMNKEKRRISKRSVKPKYHQSGNSVYNAPTEPLTTPDPRLGCVYALAYIVISIVISASLLVYGFGLYLLIWILTSLLFTERAERSGGGDGILATWKTALSDDRIIGNKLAVLSGLFVITYIAVLRAPIVWVLRYLRKWSGHFGR